jgi:hypothetical protein
LLEVFSKRSAQVEAAVAGKVTEFRHREGRDPTTWERAALTREASADTRARKTGHGVTDLLTRWTSEAAELGWTSKHLAAVVNAARVEPTGGRPEVVTVEAVVDQLSVSGSTWGRADVLRAICDLQRPVPTWRPTPVPR